MDVPTWGGYIGVVGSIFLFGTYALPTKFLCVSKNDLHPILLQLFMAVPVGVLPLFLLFFHPFSFSLMGFLGSLLWVPSSTCFILAVSCVGLGVSQAVCSGITIIVSFFWGIFLFNDPVKSLFWAICGMVLLILGIIGISTSTLDITCRKIERNPVSDSSKELKENGKDETDPLICEDTQRANTTVEKTSSSGNAKFGKIVTGFILLVINGILNGSMMVPTRYDPHSSDITYLIPFGLGVLAISPVFFLVFLSYLLLKSRGKECRYFSFKSVKIAVPTGMLMGVVWCLGNACATIVTQSPLSLTVGWPLIQVASFVAGVCGMLMGELTGKRKKIQFFASVALLLLPGIFLLAIFGGGEK